MRALYDNDTGDGTTNCRIEIHKLAPWMLDASEPFTILVRAYRAEEKGNNTFRGLLSLQVGESGDTIGISASDSSSTLRAYDNVDGAVIARQNGGGNGRMAREVFMWYAIVIDPTGTNLEATMFAVGSESDTPSTSGVETRLEWATSGGPILMANFDLTGAHLRFFQANSRISGLTSHAGYIDDITIIRNFQPTAQDIIDLFSDGTPFPFLFDNSGSGGNFTGTSMEFMHIFNSPMTNGSDRAGSGGGEAKLLGEFLEDTDTDTDGYENICVLHDWYRSGDETLYGDGNFSNFDDEWQFQVPHKFDTDTEIVGDLIKNVHPLKSEVYGVDDGGEDVVKAAETVEVLTGLTAPGIVDQPNETLRAVAEYIENGTIPKKTHSFLDLANSRAVRVGNDLLDTTFGEYWAAGAACCLWNQLIGWCYYPADTLSVQHPFFSCPQGLRSTGATPKNIATTTEVQDLQRFSFGNRSSGGIGPGGGLVFTQQSGTSTFQIVISEGTAARLPSNMTAMFGVGGEYSDVLTMTGDTKLTNDDPCYVPIYYISGASVDFDWFVREIADGGNSDDGGIGTFGSGSVSSENIIMEASMPGYGLGQSTSTVIDFRLNSFGTIDSDFQDVQVDDLMVVTSGDSLVGFAKVIAKGSTTVTIDQAFAQDSLEAGDTVRFVRGGVSMALIPVPAANASDAEYRTVELSFEGNFFLLGWGVLAAESFNGPLKDGFAPGHAGHSGHGYNPQLNECAWDGYVAQLTKLGYINGVFAHEARQSTDADYVVDEFAAALLAEDPNMDFVAISDPHNGVYDTAAASTNDAILAQSTYCGVGITGASIHGGTWAHRQRLGLISNNAHPNIFGHAFSWLAIAEQAVNLTAVESGGPIRPSTVRPSAALKTVISPSVVGRGSVQAL